VGLEATNRTPLRAFSTTLGTFASIADILLGRSDEQFVFYYLDKSGGLVRGDQRIAPGA
jgi:hypothetical protein